MTVAEITPIVTAVIGFFGCLFEAYMLGHFRGMHKADRIWRELIEGRIKAEKVRALRP